MVKTLEVNKHDVQTSETNYIISNKFIDTLQCKIRKTQQGTEGGH